ncbi:MAG: efflux RND transporter periplasmic adaptor subunit [Burkholderiaceae bacterium]|nr:efflux RND transporter periplasmic adaptor subunit [Burkholderiaceae bacterium]
MSQAESPVAAISNADNTLRRRKLFLLLGVIIAACGIGYGAYWYLYASHIISTDNAYTATEVAQVPPSVGGTVLDVKVVDTQSVKQGDVLVVIDNTDTKLALSQAEADAARATAQLAAAESDFERAGIDLKRRHALIDSGSVSGDELTRAQNAFTAGKANVAAAKAAIAQAKARADQAKVDLGRTVVRSPIDGVVAKRTVQVGQRVPQGAPLLAIVPVQEMHVDANFKEGQLEKVRIGQSAKIRADIYGSSVTYTGTVEGFSGGSGSAFAAIPAQNATGNWIKVVQRLPVRIKLDPEQLKDDPLKVGLSMFVEIDTRNSK